MSEISKHPLEGKMTQEQIDTYMKLDYHEGQAYLHELELGAGLRVRDELNSERLHEVAQPVAAAEPKFKIKVAGVEYTADTLEELNAQYEPALKAILAANQAKANDVPRNSNGTFAEKQPGLLDGADQVTSDLVMKSLLAQGIDPDALRDATALKSFEKSWMHAGKEWLATQTPESYPGGADLQKAVQDKLEILGLMDYPSAANIQKAYDAVCADADRYVALRDAKTPEEIEAILGKTRARGGASCCTR